MLLWTGAVALGSCGMYFMSNEAIEGPDGRRFYGSVTVGERGQVVIPAQARRDHGISSGDKLIVLGSPDGLALMSSKRLLEILGGSDHLQALIARSE